jgi:hypothetical protein
MRRKSEGKEVATVRRTRFIASQGRFTQWSRDFDWLSRELGKGGEGSRRG